MSAPHAYQLGVLCVASLAAMFDWRTGRIPNWLTLGAVVLALPFHAWMTSASSGRDPLEGVKWALLGAAVCTCPVLLAWRFGWVAAGDVKLVAAMGAVGGLSLGLESVFLALLCAASFILLRLAWGGTFLRTVGDGVTFAIGRTLHRKKKLVPVLAPQATVRFGPFALTGAALSLVLHGGFA
jgi:prepilin peptidase CpaA